MNDVLLGVAVTAVVVYVAFHVAYLVELKRTSAAIRGFVKNAKDSIEPALEEFRMTLGRVRKIVDDTGGMVENIRQPIR